MAFAIRMTQPGSPDVLLTAPVQTEELAPHEAWIVQEAIGVNYLDAMQRQGTVPVPFPGGIGLEAAGYVAAVGSAVTNVAVGDRVAYALGPLGAYAQERAYPAERLIRLHDDMSFDVAAAVTFKGITAQYLLKTTYPVGPNDVVLLYGVAGALGQLMVPWAKHLGPQRPMTLAPRVRAYIAHAGKGPAAR
jgi:NADPH:quinone reductase